MKTKPVLLTLVLALIGLNSPFAQVEIGTTAPKNTLQVEDDSVTTTAADGIQGQGLASPS